MSGNGPRRRRVAPGAPPALPDFPQIAARGRASGAPPRESRPALTQLVSQQPSNGSTGIAVVIKRHPAERVLEHLQAAPVDDGAKVLPAGEDSQESFEQRWNGAVGCKTSEAALALLSQIVALTCPNVAELTDPEIQAVMSMATAKLGELNPADGTQGMLAAQMVGAHTAAMEYLNRALAPGQQVEVVDRHINWAVRLMRAFNEHAETMTRLKGKGGQQRVIVEHVTVAAGGQAIVGAAVMPGGGGTGPNGR